MRVSITCLGAKSLQTFDAFLAIFLRLDSFQNFDAHLGNFVDFALLNSRSQASY